MSQNHPSITVGLPVYNASPYLRECIDSILAQTFTDFELLVIDDGSTDDSISIIESYTDNRIRLIRNRHDYIGTCNMLLNEAKGYYFARMDADDVMMYNRLEIQFEYLEAHKNIDILGSGYECFGTQNFIVQNERNKELSYLDFIDSCCLANPTTFFRIDKIRTYKIRYFSNYTYAEDYHFWSQALVNDLKIVVLNLTLLKYRVSVNQVSYIHGKEQADNTSKVRKELVHNWFRYCHSEVNKVENIRKDTSLLTVIVPFYNEGIEVKNTIQSVRETAGNNVHIILINDCSDDEIDYQKWAEQYNADYLKTTHRIGPAMAKEKGVHCCTTPYFLLIDAHMRFYGRMWAKRIIEELKIDKHCILCCQTQSFKKNQIQGIISKKDLPFGAYIYWGNNNYIPSARWNNAPSSEIRLSHNIPCVLGAAYSSSKKFWEYIKGFDGLLGYGCEEQFISLKAWLLGGKCKILPDVTIGHLYKKSSSYSNITPKYIYNYLMIARVLLPMPFKCKVFANAQNINRYNYNVANDILTHNSSKINRLWKYFHNLYNAKEFCQFVEFNYNIPKEYSVIVNQGIAKVPLIVEHLVSIKDTLPDSGLYEGKTGLIVLLYLYAKYYREYKYNVLAHSLLKDVLTTKNIGAEPFMFKNGLLGIGWSLMFLADYDFIDKALIEPYLNDVDMIVNMLCVRRMHDDSLESGFMGVLHFCVARLGYCQRYKQRHSLQGDLISEVKAKCQLLLKENKSNINNLSICSMMQFEEYGSMEWETFKIKFSDVFLTLPITLPVDTKYWNPNLKNGIIGYAINILTIKLHIR